MLSRRDLETSIANKPGDKTEMDKRGHHSIAPRTTEGIDIADFCIFPSNLVQIFKRKIFLFKCPANLERAIFMSALMQFVEFKVTSARNRASNWIEHAMTTVGGHLAERLLDKCSLSSCHSDAHSVKGVT